MSIFPECLRVLSGKAALQSQVYKKVSKATDVAKLNTKPLLVQQNTATVTIMANVFICLTRLPQDEFTATVCLFMWPGNQEQTS